MRRRKQGDPQEQQGKKIALAIISVENKITIIFGLRRTDYAICGEQGSKEALCVNTE